MSWRGCVHGAGSGQARSLQICRLGQARTRRLPLRDGAAGWREPFLPEQSGLWATFPALADFFVASSPGVKTHRTWVISPDVQTLEKRWETLQREKEQNKKEVLFHPDPGAGKTRARYIGKTISDGLGGFPTRPVSIERDDKTLLTRSAMPSDLSIGNGCRRIFAVEQATSGIMVRIFAQTGLFDVPRSARARKRTSDYLYRPNPR